MCCHPRLGVRCLLTRGAARGAEEMPTSFELGVACASQGELGQLATSLENKPTATMRILYMRLAAGVPDGVAKSPFSADSSAMTCCNTQSQLAAHPNRAAKDHEATSVDLLPRDGSVKWASSSRSVSLSRPHAPAWSRLGWRDPTAPSCLFRQCRQLHG